MDYFDICAVKLHEICPVTDAHLDLVTAVYRRHQAGERGCLKNVYLEKLRKGGVNLVFASLFLGEDELEKCRADCRKDGLKGCREGSGFLEGAILKKAVEMIACFLEEISLTEGEAVLVTDRGTLLRVIKEKQKCAEQSYTEQDCAKRSYTYKERMHTERGYAESECMEQESAERKGKKWPVGIVLYLEGLDMLEGNPALLRCFYAMGVRGAALTWNKRPKLPNPFAEGCVVGEVAEGGSEEEPITPLGVRAVSLMEELGMFVDCSHLSHRAEEHLFHIAQKPYAATHSDAKALANHPRNLTDIQITRIAGQGGVIGVNVYGKFISDKEMDVPLREFVPDKAASISPVEGICRQIAYLLEKAGEDHVGLGLDFGEGCCLTGYGQLPEITAALLRLGYPENVIRKILGENWIRFLWKILKKPPQPIKSVVK